MSASQAWFRAWPRSAAPAGWARPTGRGGYRGCQPDAARGRRLDPAPAHEPLHPPAADTWSLGTHGGVPAGRAITALSVHAANLFNSDTRSPQPYSSSST